jgi:hypothetical protein
MSEKRRSRREVVLKCSSTRSRRAKVKSSVDPREVAAVLSEREYIPDNVFHSIYLNGMLQLEGADYDIVNGGLSWNFSMTAGTRVTIVYQRPDKTMTQKSWDCK